MTRILIVDDHAVVRDGVKRILGQRPGAATFGEASTGAEGVQLARDGHWDLAVLDLSLGGRSGFDVLRELKQVRPQLPALILSMHSEEQYARRAFKAGAAGSITKDSPRAELIAAVDKVLKGGKYVSPALAERLVIDLERDSDQPRHEALSDRDFDVMRLIASGKTVTEIAGLLALSDKTISTYRARLMEKMRMKTNADLIHYAIQNRLVE